MPLQAEHFSSLIASSLRIAALVLRQHSALPADQIATVSDDNDNVIKQFGHYTLVDRELVKLETLRAETGVDETVIVVVEISTVFPGLDQNYLRRGPPVLFETMIFGGWLDDSRNRCATWDEAKAMHAEAVRLVRAGHLHVVK